MLHRIAVGCGVVALMALAVAVCAARPKAPADGNETRQLLSEHQTIARFGGLAQRRCMGLTSMCPDRCGHSGSFASFDILTYTHYAKPGEYGDPKSDTFMFQVEDNMGKAKAPADIAAKVKALAAGDHVLLDWRHDYVTRREGGGSVSSPERPVVRLEKITAEQARQRIQAAATRPATRPS